MTSQKEAKNFFLNEFEKGQILKRGQTSEMVQLFQKTDLLHKMCHIHVSIGTFS